ncbi:MAG: anaerobic ribonucleoside-triphosphate reductase [Candidatus Ranarchaeia archaeon]
MTEKKMTSKYKRTRCETYSRVVGYLRPVNQWNDGKREEFKMRTVYDKAEGTEQADT